MSFREIIKAEVKQRGLSGYRVGKLAEMPIRTVQAYLSGERDLSGERVAKIAAVLGFELKLVKGQKGKA